MKTQDVLTPSLFPEPQEPEKKVEPSPPPNISERPVLKKRAPRWKNKGSERVEPDEE